MVYILQDITLLIILSLTLSQYVISMYSLFWDDIAYIVCIRSKQFINGAAYISTESTLPKLRASSIEIKYFVMYLELIYAFI